jgi:hypothetical protein
MEGRKVGGGSRQRQGVSARNTREIATALERFECAPMRPAFLRFRKVPPRLRPFACRRNRTHQVFRRKPCRS